MALFFIVFISIILVFICFLKHFYQLLRWKVIHFLDKSIEIKSSQVEVFEIKIACRPLARWKLLVAKAICLEV